LVPSTKGGDAERVVVVESNLSYGMFFDSRPLVLTTWRPGSAPTCRVCTDPTKSWNQASALEVVELPIAGVTNFLMISVID